MGSCAERAPLHCIPLAQYDLDTEETRDDRASRPHLPRGDAGESLTHASHRYRNCVREVEHRYRSRCGKYLPELRTVSIDTTGGHFGGQANIQTGTAKVPEQEKTAYLSQKPIVPPVGLEPTHEV
jgi:hypothetical protein